MDLTVIIASFGDDRWLQLARERAVPSLDGFDRVVLYHAEEQMTVGHVRNLAVLSANPSGWLLFLDPDDELAPGYIDAMTAAVLEPVDEPRRPDVDVLYAPALQLIVNGVEQAPTLLDDRDIIDGNNPCPIGTLIHRSTFDRVRGFWNERAWEDWSLFRRVVLTGGRIQFVPDAVYRAHVDLNGRNSTVRHPKTLRRQIVDSHARWMS